MTLTNTTISDNPAAGIENFGGILTLTNSIVRGNSLGGISNSGGGILTLTNSTVSDNSGFGIDTGPDNSTVFLINGTVSGNRTEGFSTAGIRNSANMFLTNSTVAAIQAISSEAFLIMAAP